MKSPESENSLMIRGKDPLGNDMLQEISRKDLGRQNIKFKAYFSNYLK